MTLNGNGKNFTLTMKNGWFLRDGVRVEQSIYTETGNGKKEKGLKNILQERGLWVEGTRRRDKAAEILSNQPDFKEQRSWLEEEVGRMGEKHRLAFFPKFASLVQLKSAGPLQNVKPEMSAITPSSHWLKKYQGSRMAFQQSTLQSVFEVVHVIVWDILWEFEF